MEGIHNRYRLEVDFHESLSILHGKNGTGKTTLIHAIANVANCDFLRFVFLDFSNIEVSYSNSNWVCISREKENYRVDCASGKSFRFSRLQALEALTRNEDDRYGREYTHEIIEEQKKFTEENNLKIVNTSYFPAFRTILEAWSVQMEDERFPGPRGRTGTTSKKITNFSRNLFGRFLPIINFPSPIDIEESLRNEIRDAQVKIGRYDSTVFTESFVKVFSALLSGDQNGNEDAENILKEISELANTSPGEAALQIEGPTQSTYQRLQHLIKNGDKAKELASTAIGALTVYRDALMDRKKISGEYTFRG